ncbi:MAG: hypothetical protein L6R36_001988 [Xanthoria steineri]|nr:MAG: hypothetical protein L6R36_001988 [Xanthoria steineri]
MNYTSRDYLRDDDEKTASVAGQRSVALSNKLSGVLSVSYADSEIRDALHLLDLKNVQNTPDLRRSIRSDLQKDVIDCNSSIVREFGQVAEQLKSVGSIISSLNACCEDVQRQVAAARQENLPVLDEASALLKEKDDVEKKKQLLIAFNKHFVLPEEDLMVLTATTQAIDAHFFAVLERTKQIHADCQILLGSENQRLGLELMEQTSRQLNSGYQKLHRWIQKEFKALDLENPQINAFIRRSLRTLAERPALFENCLESFSEARRHVLTDGFYNALTGSSANNDPTMKPIEFHAHDALRYTGDILAWAHSATVSERESLQSLFISEGDEMAKGIRAGRQSEPWSAIDGESFDGRKALDGLVNGNMTGVARALRQRIEQAVQSQDDSVTVYKIANLISFYRVTLTKLLGPDSSIMEALSALEDVAMCQFKALQSDQTATVQAEFTQAPSDLSVPDILEEALTQVKALMKSYESSLTPVDSRENDFKPILSQTLNPVLDSCDSLAKDLGTPAIDIFLLNCYDSARSTLQPFDFTQWLVGQIDQVVASSTSNLIDYQHAFFLHVSGLHSLLTALTPLTSSDEDLLQMPHLAPFQPAALMAASQTLDEFLPSALIDALENLKRLNDTKLAGDVTSEAADRFCADFEFVETRLAAVDETVAAQEERGGSDDDDHEDDGEENRRGTNSVKVQRDEENDKVPLRSFYPRTSGDIRVLLS